MLIAGSIFPSMAELHDWFFNMLHVILIFIDRLAYSLVGKLYKLFALLATFPTSNTETYNAFVQRIYLLLGIIMMFVLVYSFLMGVINPDNAEKNDISPQKFLMNIVISIIIIAVLPTVFDFAAQFQNTMINGDGTGTALQKLIFGISSESESEATETLSTAGYTMAVNTFSAFFQPTDEWCNKNKGLENLGNPDASISITECEKKVKSNNGTMTLYDAKEETKKDGNFNRFTNFSKKTFVIENEDDDDNYYDGETLPISHMFPISTIAGGYLCVVLISFCFDLGKRIVKLLFLEIIAPVPAICRAIPKGKSIFDNWVKMIISVYLEVFVRLLAIYFGTFLIAQIMKNGAWDHFSSEGFFIVGLAKAFVIMGIVTFIKELPKFLGNLFPAMNSDGMSLGIRDKLKAGGAYTAGAALGSGATSLVRNGVNAFGNKKNWQNAKGKVTAGSVMRNLGRGLGSAAAGGISGTARGFSQGRNAGSRQEMRAAASNAVAATEAKRDERASDNSRYKANGNIFTKTALGGRMLDAAQDVKDWATGGASKYEADIEQGKKFKGLSDNIKDAAAKVRDKFRSNSALVKNMDQSKWKNKEIAANIQAEYEKLKTTHGGKFSLANLDNEIDNAKSTQIDKADYMVTKVDQAKYSAAVDSYSALVKSGAVSTPEIDKSKFEKAVVSMEFDEAGFNKALSQAITNGTQPPKKGDYTKEVKKVEFDQAGFEKSVDDFFSLVKAGQVNCAGVNKAEYTTTEFDEARYDQDVIKKTDRIEALESMKIQLEEEANNLIIDASSGGAAIQGIDADKLQDVGNNVTNFEQAYKMAGSTITDNLSGKTFKNISDSGKPVSETIKNITEAAEHNASDARSNAARYEELKAAREKNK